MKIMSMYTSILCLLALVVYGTGAYAQTQTFTPIADAEVYEGSKLANYGIGTTFRVKKIPGSANTRITYLKFDLSSFNLTQTGKAVLRVYLSKQENLKIPVIVEALCTNGNSWAETTLNWSNKPQLLNSIATTLVNSAGNYYEWDISDYIKTLNPTSTNNTSFSEALQDVAAAETMLTFNSKESATNKPELVISEAPSTNQLSGNFYVDAINGNDNNNGNSEATAWKTVNAPNSKVFLAGSKISFKSGQTFPGTLLVTGSGNASNPIVYNTYGGTAQAVIDAQGGKTAMYAYNREYIELKNLGLTNYRNTTISDDDLLHALLLINENGGTLNHIYLDGLHIFNVNSSDIADAAGTKNHGGVFFDVLGNTVPSKWNDVQVTNCNFENLSRTGINFESDWELRNSNTSFGDNLGDGQTDNWVPSTNVVFRYNTFKHIAGNGLVVRVAVNPLIEYNLFDYCGETISGNAAFNFNTDGAIFQFNEAMHTVYNDGDTDARGIDSDFRTKNTYIQYNYLHDNGLGGVVATGGDQQAGANPSIPERFNVNTVIRYNIIENNARQAISFSGAMKSAEVYNNVVYNDENYNNVLIVRVAAWGDVPPKNLNFKNNIFYLKGTGHNYSFTSGSSYSFNKNLFYYPSATNEPTDAGKIKADPLFLSPGNNNTNGYKLKPGSPALGVGALISNNGGRDYYNNTVSTSTAPNMGLYEGPGTNILPITLTKFTAKKINNGTFLNWATASEINNDYFEVERSLDVLNFTKIGAVDGAGDSKNTLNYSFTDEFPVNGNNYYRLKQVDKDGTSSFSEVLAVNFSLKNDAEELVVYPNPATSFVSINREPNANEKLEVKIYNLQGELVLSEKIESSSEIKVSVLNLKTGIFILKMTDLNTNKIVGKSKFLKY